MEKKIILASTSPRRKELLNMIIGNNFQVIPSKFEEDNEADMTPLDLARHNALEKARDVAKDHKGIIIGCDTIVEIDGEVLGKPKDDKDAERMLSKQSGRWIDVISGIAVIDNTRGYSEMVSAETTKVKMDEMSKDDIKKYIDSGDPKDKAGAFGMQSIGAVFIEKVEGCWSNVVGLPVYKLGKMLREFGIDTMDYHHKD